MRKPPRDPRDPNNTKNAIIKALQQMGINPRVVRMVDLQGNEVDLNIEQPDNVIPFPKSSSPPFGHRTPPPSHPTHRVTHTDPASVMETLVASAEAVRANPSITGCIVLMLEGDNPDGRLICYQAGLTKYEAVGMIEDAKHDIVCGFAGPFDDGDAA